MKAKEYLQNFEYEYLPHVFYTRTGYVVLILANDHESLGRFMNDYLDAGGQKNPFRDDEFHCGLVWQKEPYFAIEADFPVAGEGGCRYAVRAFLFYHQDWKDLRYFLVETDASGAASICEIAGDGSRTGHGLCPPDPAAELDACRALYQEAVESQADFS